VPLPDDLQPSTLAVAGPDLIVAGPRATTDDREPALAVIGNGAPRTVRLVPASPYAKVADLVSIAVDGRRVAALGAAHGGAHANFRWTIWTGTTDVLVDRPQTFETFGGQSAGSLTDVVSTADGPRIVGSWQGESALDIAIWRPDGNRWVRLDSSGTPLANTPTLQVSGRAAASRGTGMIITGSVLDLSDDVRQNAAVWLSNADRDWRLVRLPDPGARSEALSARCAGSVCWIAGYVDDRLAIWSLTGDQAERIADLPTIPIDVDGPAPQVITASAPAAAFSADGRIGVVARGAGGWIERTGPAGSLVAATGLDGRVYLAATTSSNRAELWAGEAP
jgi:hypothetical protein